jgi:hypothetical protein
MIILNITSKYIASEILLYIFIYITLYFYTYTHIHMIQSMFCLYYSKQFNKSHLEEEHEQMYV